MNPGLVVKLRPSGPWRIGPDSGARNRVDVIYHSDSLYSAITSAMARLGWLEEWLDATARTGASALAFASCFPYMDDLGFVVPPRTVWPPASPSAKSARVRWKSARFVPLKVVQSILAGKRLDENQWTVDGPSDCLVPNGRPGPFRTAVRWSAGVDRLTGMTERHSTACIEFRPGSGLWTVVSFADETAHARWADPVKAAFRLLADSGFGGERSRGWGRSEAPEFTDGMLPELILPLPKPETTAAEPSGRAATIRERSQRAAMRQTAKVTSVETEVLTAAASAAPAEAVTPPAEASAPEPLTLETAPEAPAPAEEVSAAPPAEASEPEPPAAEAAPEASAPETEPSAPPLEVVEATPEPEPEPPVVEAESPTHPHWLLSVFTPAAADTVDWRRGNYTVLARGGRVDSPAGSGELKKQIQMVAEGSVIYTETAPRGSAADVAPDGFAHPVFRSGFALAIPLPEVS